MTREQAKREIDSLDYYLQNHTDDYSEESHTAMMMAISALSASDFCVEEAYCRGKIDGIKECTARLKKMNEEFARGGEE